MLSGVQCINYLDCPPGPNTHRSQLALPPNRLNLLYRHYVPGFSHRYQTDGLDTHGQGTEAWFLAPGLPLAQQLAARRLFARCSQLTGLIPCPPLLVGRACCFDPVLFEVGAGSCPVSPS